MLTQEAMQKGICTLLDACRQATFGFQDKDVLDLDYRRAFKLEPSKFSTNFHPFDHGVLDTISQLMIPLQPRTHEIHAELYRFNIYGPAGKLKPHVDTPRSNTQFGSLVVCLPCQHTGGALLVSTYSLRSTRRLSRSSNTAPWLLSSVCSRSLTT